MASPSPVLVLFLLLAAAAAAAASSSRVLQAASPSPSLPPPTPAAALPTFSVASPVLDAPRFIYLPGLDTKVSPNDGKTPFSLQLVDARQPQSNVSGWHDVPLGLRTTSDGASLMWVVAEIPDGERVRVCVVTCVVCLI